MPLSLIYLGKRFCYRVFEFFYHWYGRSPRIYSNHVFNMLQKMDYRIAWRITLKHLFEPLYKDYTIIGHILGFIFRGARLFMGSIVYLITFAIVIAVYLTWLSIPPYIIFRIINSL